MSDDYNSEPKGFSFFYAQVLREILHKTTNDGIQHYCCSESLGFDEAGVDVDRDYDYDYELERRIACGSSASDSSTRVVHVQPKLISPPKLVVHSRPHPSGNNNPPPPPPCLDIQSKRFPTKQQQEFQKGEWGLENGEEIGYDDTCIGDEEELVSSDDGYVQVSDHK